MATDRTCIGDVVALAQCQPRHLTWLRTLRGNNGERTIITIAGRTTKEKTDENTGDSSTPSTRDEGN
jgi:hypothetical protein